MWTQQEPPAKNCNWTVLPLTIAGAQTLPLVARLSEFAAVATKTTLRPAYIPLSVAIGVVPVT